MTEQAKTGVEAGDRALETPTPEQFKLWEAACDYCRIDGRPAKRSDGKWMHYYEHEDPSECLAGAVAESAMNAQERELARTLNNLKCEVVGWLGLARPMLIQELSITNVRVMEHHVEEAERLLAERGEVAR